MKMMWLPKWVMVVFVVCVGNANAAVINVGTWNIPADTLLFSIPIQITGEIDEIVTDMVLRVQTADGGTEFGGSEDGPAIVGVDYTNTIWNATDFDAFFSPNLGIGDFRQLVESNVSIDFSTGTPVPANGVLARVTVDVSGLPAGRSYGLFLTGTLAGDTTFLGLNSSQIVNGSIEIIPEPSSGLLLLLTLGLGICRQRPY